MNKGKTDCKGRYKSAIIHIQLDYTRRKSQGVQAKQKLPKSIE